MIYDLICLIRAAQSATRSTLIRRGDRLKLHVVPIEQHPWSTQLVGARLGTIDPALLRPDDGLAIPLGPLPAWLLEPHTQPRVLQFVFVPIATLALPRTHLCMRQFPQHPVIR